MLCQPGGGGCPRDSSPGLGRARARPRGAALGAPSAPDPAWGQEPRAVPESPAHSPDWTSGATPTRQALWDWLCGARRRGRGGALRRHRGQKSPAGRAGRTAELRESGGPGAAVRAPCSALSSAPGLAEAGSSESFSPARPGGPTRGTAQKMASEVRPAGGAVPWSAERGRAPMASRGRRDALRIICRLLIIFVCSRHMAPAARAVSVCLSVCLLPPSLPSAFGVSPGHSHPRTQLGVAPGGKGSDHCLGSLSMYALPRRPPRSAPFSV